MEYLDVKAKTREDIHEWIIDGFVPGMDLKATAEIQVKQGFAGESFLDNFSKEKREMFSNMSIIFSKGCESEFDYLFLIKHFFQKLSTTKSLSTD